MLGIPWPVALIALLVVVALAGIVAEVIEETSQENDNQ